MGQPRATLRRHERVHYQTEEAPAQGSGRIMHLVLFVVGMNIVACLLAGQAASIVERETMSAVTQKTARNYDVGERIDVGRAALFTVPAGARRGAGVNGVGSPN